MNNTPLIFRLWRYFRDGYHIYLSFPLTIFNFLTLAYFLLLERIPFMKAIFPHFSTFAIVTLIVVAPIGVLVGWLHIRRSRAYATESIISTINNPLNVYNQMVFLKAEMDLFKAIGKDPPDYLVEMYEYWKSLDERFKWRP